MIEKIQQMINDDNILPSYAELGAEVNEKILFELGELAKAMFNCEKMAELVRLLNGSHGNYYSQIRSYDHPTVTFDDGIRVEYESHLSLGEWPFVLQSGISL